LFSLLQARRAGASDGEPIPQPFASLTKLGVRLLRGQTSLVTGAAGTGKSATALTVALKAGVSVLYLSADSDPYVQTARTISILTGATMEESGAWARTGAWPEEVEEALRSNIFFRWDFTASPTLDDVESAVECYYEIYGEFPFLVIVDNVTNVRGASQANQEDPFSGLESLMDYLSSMARETGAHVLGLHHATAGYNDSNKPIPLSGVKGQISRVPAMILTLHKAGERLLGVSLVKNRNGRAAADGSLMVELECDLSRMEIHDPPYPYTTAKWQVGQG
jgi:hypothetical protein